ncbi:MAG: sigma 54-interacting transcriptional regulator [Deltaproteobacteria bacterium]|nr:sigma 54-interacting transcriptional regulator [Deltaproteobacteria bacterium]
MGIPPQDQSGKAAPGSSEEAARLADLLEFEHLLSEVSARYINVPVSEIDDIVRGDLGRLGTLLKADRCAFHRIARDKGLVRIDQAYIWWPNEDDAQVARFHAWVTDPKFLEKFAYFFRKWTRGEIVQFHRLEELPREAKALKDVYGSFGVKSALAIPISVGRETVGALVLSTVHAHRTWAADLIPRLRLFGEVIANALMRKRNEEALRSALAEVQQLKERLEADYAYLTEELQQEHEFGEIVGKSEVLRGILRKVKQVAPTNATVLIQGETGTGKGLVARAIHNASRRKDRPLMQVNCATLTATLIESELFGHEKGAFTGAAARRAGRFELADGTTLFLDEIGELPLDLQAKLLRVLQDGEFERVGGSTTIRTDVRVIAATNRDLEKEVEAGRFRSDLWYRLSVFPIFVPPLRERVEDIPLFVSWFVEKYAKQTGRRVGRLSRATLRELESYSWPGNVRELENLVERALITSTGEELHIEVPGRRSTPAKAGMTLADAERQHILSALKEAHWRIEGPRGAASRLGLKPSTLRSRIQKLEIRRPA